MNKTKACSLHLRHKKQKRYSNTRSGCLRETGRENHAALWHRLLPAQS